ncbi:MAG: hypothetical protein WKF90_03625 [Pyrinomonadaceae bacterium]
MKYSLPKIHACAAPLYVRTEPMLDALHNDSRFQYLLRRSGL